MNFLSDLITNIESNSRQLLQFKDNDEVNNTCHTNDLVKSLIVGCVGSLNHGVARLCAILTMNCRVFDTCLDL